MPTITALAAPTTQLRLAIPIDARCLADAGSLDGGGDLGAAFGAGLGRRGRLDGCGVGVGRWRGSGGGCGLGTLVSSMGTLEVILSVVGVVMFWCLCGEGVCVVVAVVAVCRVCDFGRGVW